MLMEDKEITKQINENYVHWDEIQTRVNVDTQIDFDTQSTEFDEFQSKEKEFVPLISDSDFEEENEILFRKKIIRKIQEQHIDSSNFYRYHEEERLMKAFTPLIADEYKGKEYQNVIKDLFHDFIEIPYFYPTMNDNENVEFGNPEHDDYSDHSGTETHTLNNSRINLVKNEQNEIESIEVTCSCGERTTIQLKYED